MSSMPQPQSQLSGSAPFIDSRAGRSTSRAWRLACAVVLLLTGVFWMYRPSSASLIELWNDTSKTTYTHGFVIAAIVAWLVLRNRDRLADKPWSPSLAAGGIAILLGLAWLVAVRGGIELIHQLLLLALLWLSVWAVFGIAIARTLWLPIGYLVFAIPVWDQINSVLQAATVVAVQTLLKISSIPAYVEGNFVHLAAGLFEVAGGCSGIHFFIVSLALATLYGEIGRDTLKVRIQLILLAAGLALLSNWLRVYIIVVAGHLTNMQHYLVRVEHYNFGWVVFAVMMAIFFLIARRFVTPAREESTRVAISDDVGGKALGIVGLALVAVIAVPVWEIVRPVQPVALPEPQALLPQVTGHWSRSADDSSAWQPVFTGADQTVRAEYIAPGEQRVQVFVATYASQRQSKELVAYGNALIGPGEGSVVSTARVEASGPAKESIVEAARERALIRYYYRIGTHRTERGFAAQLWYGLKALGGGAVSSVVAVRTACSPDCDAARAVLDDFAASSETRSAT